MTDKLLEQKKQELRKQEEIDKIIADSEADKSKKEISRYEAEKKKYAGNKKALEALEKVHHRNMALISLGSATDEIKRVEDKHALERQLKVKAHRDEISTFKGSKSEKKEIQARHNQELQELDKQHFTELATLLQQFLSSGEMGEIEIDFDLLSDEEKASLLNKLEDLRKKLASLGLVTDEAGYSLFNSQGSLFGISEADWEQFFDNLKEGKFGWEDLAFAIQAAGALGNEIIGVLSSADKKQTAIESNQLKDFKKKNDEKEKILSGRLKAGLISQEQYDAEVQVMEEEYNAKKEEMEIAQAKRKKKMDIASAIINVALAVTKTLAEFAFPWSLIPAGLVAVMGAAKIAMIASTPIVAGAEQGGFVVEREQDGQRFNARLNPDKRGFISSPTVLVGEKGTEYVIPNEGLENPSLAPFIATMESARKNGTFEKPKF